MAIKRSSVNLQLLTAFVLLFAAFGLKAEVIVMKTSPSYTSVEVVSSALLKVNTPEGFGLLTPEGNVVAPCIYDQITPFAEKHCLLMKDNKVAAIADLEGNISTIRESLRANMKCPFFSEGLLPVKNDRDYWGYIDYSGSLVIQCRYLRAYPFSCGLASVQWAEDSYFVHINKTGQISYPRAGFSDPDISFASSFVKDGDNAFALLYINGSFYKRDLNGNKDVSFQLRGNVSLFSREISVGRSLLKFDEAWRPYEITYGAKVYSFHNAPIVDGTFSPTSGIRGVKLNDKEYSVEFEGKQFCSVYCEDFKSLNGNYCAIKIRGLWQVAQVVPNEKFVLSLDDTVRELNHLETLIFSGTVSIPYVVDLENVTLMASAAGSEYSSVPIRDGKVSISYSPLALQYDNDVDISLYCKVGIVNYPVVSIPVTFSYKNALEPSTQAVVSLDSNALATIKVSVKNTSSHPSGRVEVLVDGTSIGMLDSVPPHAVSSIPFVKSIDVGDEDSVVRNFTIELKEDGCPSSQKPCKITFERYYIK